MLIFRVVVVICLLANSVVNCSLLRFSYLQLIMVRLAGAGHIVSPRAQLVTNVKSKYPGDNKEEKTQTLLRTTPTAGH